MPLRDALEDALDQASAGDTVEVESGGGKARVDVVDVDRLGVRVRGVKVTRDRDIPLEQLTHELPDRVRSLPQRVAPIEIDSGLGGGIFRTPVDDRKQDYFQIDVRGRDSEVERYVVEDGERKATDFTITREGLGRLVDELS